MVGLFILIISVICASGIFSLIEAAILSLPLMRARLLQEEGRRNSKTLLRIKEDIHITIASIVIINNTINIAGSIFIGQKVTALFGNQWLGISAIFLTFLIIVFGEVIPKTIGERYKVPVSLVFAEPIRLLVWLLRPVVQLILRVEIPFTKKYKQPMPKVTEEEIRLMLKLGRDAGTVEMDEEVLCNRVFKLNDVRASQVMRPISQMFALPANKTIGELKDEIIDSRFSRIAVFDNDPLNIIGVVEHRLLLRHIARDNYQVLVKEFMTPPVFVNHQTKADAILEKFLAYNQHLFIVRDDANQAIGLVTMEDVLEELFGEIYDEKDMKARSSQSKASQK